MISCDVPVPENEDTKLMEEMDIDQSTRIINLGNVKIDSDTPSEVKGRLIFVLYDNMSNLRDVTSIPVETGSLIQNQEEFGFRELDKSMYSGATEVSVGEKDTFSNHFQVSSLNIHMKSTCKDMWAGICMNCNLDPIHANKTIYEVILSTCKYYDIHFISCI